MKKIKWSSYVLIIWICSYLVKASMIAKKRVRKIIIMKPKEMNKQLKHNVQIIFMIPLSLTSVSKSFHKCNPSRLWLWKRKFVKFS